MRGYRAERAFDGERVLPGGALVLVEDGRIAAVHPARTAAPDGVAVTSRPGTTLLPGLVDTHVHLCGDGGPRALDQLPELGPDEIDRIVATGLERQLAAGVTAVRDLGDLGYAVVDRVPRTGPTVVAAGPPITSPGGHCWSLGGQARGVPALRAAVRERAERGAGVVKLMASGGFLTPGTDTATGQSTDAEVRAVVDEAHRLGRPVTAHAYPLTAIRQVPAAGVDGIEHGVGRTGTGWGIPRSWPGSSRGRAPSSAPPWASPRAPRHLRASRGSSTGSASASRPAPATPPGCTGPA